MTLTKQRLWEISRGSQPTSTEILLMSLELYGVRESTEDLQEWTYDDEEEEHETRFGTLVPWGGG